jgi:hypothetical protein
MWFRNRPMEAFPIWRGFFCLGEATVNFDKFSSLFNGALFLQGVHKIL